MKSLAKIDSPKHRKFIASLPCLITGEESECVVPHHLLRTGEHGVGTKSCDMWCVPMHSEYHDALHKNGNEVEFFQDHGWGYRQVTAHALHYDRISPCKRIRQKVKEWEAGNGY